VLVIGWDGASFRAIDPLLAAGQLPHLARLLARGARADLESTRVPISSAAWTTATTGKGVGVHGVFGFHEPVEGSYALTLASARSSQAAPLWRLLTGRGLGSLVFGVPLTYPPEPILGTLVCGMLAPPSATFTWPGALAGELRARGFVPDLEPWLEERQPTLVEALAQLDLREELLDELLAAADWRLAWLVFKELDVLAHFSYGRDLLPHLAPLYARLDALLGSLLERVGPGTNVLLVSDHGFTSYARGLNLHAWLVARGFATRRGEASRAPLPEGPLARRFADEWDQRLSELDLARTQALAWTSEGNFGSVRLNRAGREPGGIVTDADEGALLVRIEAELFAHPDVVHVWRADELHPGPARAALPDIVFETRPEVQVFAERGDELEGRYDPLVPDHDLLGIFVAAGPAFTPGARAERLTLLDLAPLVLHLLGEPVPNEMTGTVPLDLFCDARAPARVPEQEFAALAPPRTGPVYTPEELQALEQSLRALGYGD
jgi:predicted AlkP superfamily phosphohydrolase/phosphomutase